MARTTKPKKKQPDDERPRIIPPEYREEVNSGEGHRYLTCRSCGSEHVAWQQSMRTGKFYLSEVFLKAGEKFTSHTEFHSKYCGHPELHDEMQVQYGIEAEAEVEYNEAEYKKAERHERDAKRRWERKLRKLTCEERDARIDELEEDINESSGPLAIEEMRKELKFLVMLNREEDSK